VPLSQFGENFPFVGRQDFELQVKEWFRNYLIKYEEALKQSKMNLTKNDTTVLIATGTPGIGKTRSLKEIFNIISTEVKKNLDFAPVSV